MGPDAFSDYCRLPICSQSAIALPDGDNAKFLVVPSETDVHVHNSQLWSPFV